MTRALTGGELAVQINDNFPNTVDEYTDISCYIQSNDLPKVARFLKETPNLNFAFLRSVSAVDYIDHFEIIYHLLSMRLNLSAVVKTKCPGREDPCVPSVVDVWRGANLQEREILDLMGIRFDGHPNMKRIMLWEGFQGHPLRKDFLR